MGAVYVCIRHNNHFVISQLGQIKLRADSHSQGSDHRCNLSLPMTLSSRAFSTLSIFPHRGKIAWNRESRPCVAEPPAESPSTI